MTKDFSKQTLIIALISGIVTLAVFAVISSPALGSQAVITASEEAPGQVRDYWTVKRMRHAAPMPPPRSSSVGIRSNVGPEEGEPESVAPSSPVELVSPSADFSVGETSAFPARVNGKLFTTTAEGGDTRCSASVVTSPGKSLLFTAGHCVYNTHTGGWSTNLLFIPAYEEGVEPYGSWAIAQKIVPTGWTSSASSNYAYDTAVLTVYPNAAGSRIQDVVGGWGVTFNTSANQFHQLLGYPGTPEPYTGENMIGCNTNFAGYETKYTTTSNGVFAAQPCFQGHGASGSPLVTNGGLVQGVYSHFYCELEPSECGYVYAAYFGTAAQNLYNGYRNAAPTVPVSAAPPPSPSPAPQVIQTAPKPRWCGRVKYHLQHRYYRPYARRRLVNNYRRHCL